MDEPLMLPAWRGCRRAILRRRHSVWAGSCFPTWRLRCVPHHARGVPP